MTGGREKVTNHARADHDGRLTALDWSAANRVHGNRSRLGHRGVLKGNIVWHGVEIAGGHAHEFRKGPMSLELVTGHAKDLPTVA